MNILDYIENIKQENEGPRITAQKPRNMADGGRIGYENGQLVRNTADGSRPGYSGDAIKLPDSPDAGTKHLGDGVYKVTTNE